MEPAEVKKLFETVAANLTHDNYTKDEVRMLLFAFADKIEAQMRREAPLLKQEDESTATWCSISMSMLEGNSFVDTAGRARRAVESRAIAEDRPIGLVRVVGVCKPPKNQVEWELF